MRSLFDPEFSYQASRSMIPTFSHQINHWLDNPRPENPSGRSIEGAFILSTLKECKLLAFRLIASSVYGDAFDETVGTNLGLGVKWWLIRLVRQVFTKLVELSELHQKLVGNAIFKKKLTFGWFNVLPTAEKHAMDKFQTDWEHFNDSILESGQQVRASPL